jgi:hypothetical protein
MMYIEMKVALIFSSQSRGYLNDIFVKRGFDIVNVLNSHQGGPTK